MSEKIDTLGLINTILHGRTGVVDAERRERGESEQSLDGLYLSAHLCRTLMLFQRIEQLIVAMIAALTAELRDVWGASTSPRRRLWDIAFQVTRREDYFVVL